jgi:hypothetical protein
MGLKRISLVVTAFGCVVAAGCRSLPKGVVTNPAVRAEKGGNNEEIRSYANEMIAEGEKIFRFDTFGSERFWGDQLQLHKAILSSKKGGLAEGLTPRQALQLGLKADYDRVPQLLGEVLQEGAIDFDNPDTTLELLRANAVVGVIGKFDKQENLVSVGITCALCHSTVNDSFMKGIGKRLDGWPNRDLDVGKVASLAPNLQPIATMLGVDVATVKKVLLSWGPGKYDAELNMDGKAFRPDGKPAATVLPAAFGLAGVNLHTYTGFGSVTYWNAYVANTQMYGQGVFFDSRLSDPKRYPIAAKMGWGNVRGGLLPDTATNGSGGERVHIDHVSAKLAPLHFYQLAIPPPKPPKGSFNEDSAKRGEGIFTGKARCSTCHVPPLYTEPGHALHAPEEIGIDDFQAKRSPEGKYRTTPLRGLFTRAKGGFYHDGRFPDLAAVVTHYQGVMKLSLSDSERADLVEFLKSL